MTRNLSIKDRLVFFTYLSSRMHYGGLFIGKTSEEIFIGEV